jgi:DNA processing protein
MAAAEVEALPPAAFAVALSTLRGVGSVKLRAMLEAAPPEVAFRHARRQAAAGGATVADPAELWRRLAAAGIAVHLRGDPHYPAALDHDPEPPALLYSAGDLGVLARRRVAIVGTRRATYLGRDVARELGRGLAEQGVAVISGLALGIDGAAHEGALVPPGAAPVGVVGSGLDVVYPARHARLWERVRGAGALLSEAPLGAAPEPWRFPERNRVIAGLAEVVVVVESRRAGGSMHTVRAALDRGVPVMAVPGSVRSRASEGTNQLIAEGAIPVTDVDDVLVALGLATVGATAARPGDAEAGLDAEEQQVLRAVDWTPTQTEDVLRRTGLDPARGAALLTRLEMHGLLRAGSGWWERA